MKNENIGTSDIEKILKDKMNELSDSVDCFNKISARAFPEKDPDFYESGFTVSDLENVTGKRNHSKALRWIAIAAALILCFVFIPQSNVMKQLFSNRSSTVIKKFQNIITEINDETEIHQYQQLDVPLDYYIKNDVLVTPLFSCPFEDSGKEDTMVRIFIRETGAGQFHDYDTAQVYAVEYIGEYSDDNILAAAKSIYSFSEDDLSTAQYEIGDQENIISTALEQNFTAEKEYIRDTDNDIVSVASLSYGCYIKKDDKTIWANTLTLYDHKGTDNSEEYFYDSVTLFGNDIIEIPDRQSMWKTSIYYNGISAFPEETNSSFNQKELFITDESQHLANSHFDSVGDFNSFSMNFNLLKTNSPLQLFSSNENSIISTVLTPADPDQLYHLRIYFPYNSDNNISENTLTVMCNWTMLTSIPLNQKSDSSVSSYTEIERIKILIETIANESNSSATARLEMMLSDYESQNKNLINDLNKESDEYQRKNIGEEIYTNETIITIINQKLEELKSDE